jgi:hypothetical protein
MTRAHRQVAPSNRQNLEFGAHFRINDDGFSALREVLSDVQAACDALPQAEQERYRSAQESVVNARRSAETHEGLLQVC